MTLADQPVRADPKPDFRKAKRKQKSWTKRLDKAVGDIVRARGRCQDPRLDHVCKGPLQWCHGFSRRYHAVRWDTRNGFCLCAASHNYYTTHPIEWDSVMRQLLGHFEYEVLRVRALQGGKVDHKAVWDSLQ